MTQYCCFCGNKFLFRILAMKHSCKHHKRSIAHCNKQLLGGNERISPKQRKDKGWAHFPPLLVFARPQIKHPEYKELPDCRANKAIRFAFEEKGEKSPSFFLHYTKAQFIVIFLLKGIRMRLQVGTLQVNETSKNHSAAEIALKNPLEAEQTQELKNQRACRITEVILSPTHPICFFPS